MTRNENANSECTFLPRRSDLDWPLVLHGGKQVNPKSGNDISANKNTNSHSKTILHHQNAKIQYKQCSSDQPVIIKSKHQQQSLLTHTNNTQEVCVFV